LSENVRQLTFVTGYSLLHKTIIKDVREEFEIYNLNNKLQQCRSYQCRPDI